MTTVAAGGLARDAGLNAALRVAALAGKLLLVIYLGKYLSVGDMAVYGLLTTSVGIAVTILGLEFYAYSTREILAAPLGRRGSMLRDQAVFHAAAYTLLFPLALPLFLTGVLPWSLAAAFYALSILEHLGQETARLFNTLFRPVFSTGMFFIRSAAWGLVIMPVGLLYPAWNTLGLIVGGWIAGVFVSVVLSVRELRRTAWPSSAGTIDWAWIRRGLVVAMPFMLATVSYRVIELADRYMIHFMLTPADVAVYSFYTMLANVIPAVVGAAITSVLTPRIIEAWQQGRLEEYRRYFRTMTLSASGTSLACVPIGFFGIAWVQQFTGKAEYAAHLGTCAVLLLATAVAVIAQLPGVALYARHQDRVLLAAVLVGAVTNTVLNLLLIPSLGIAGAAWSTVLSYVAMGAYQLQRLMRLQEPAA